MLSRIQNVTVRRFRCILKKHGYRYQQERRNGIFSCETVNMRLVFAKKVSTLMREDLDSRNKRK